MPPIYHVLDQVAFSPGNLKTLRFCSFDRISSIKVRCAFPDLYTRFFSKGYTVSISKGNNKEILPLDAQDLDSTDRLNEALPGIPSEIDSSKMKRHASLRLEIPPIRTTVAKEFDGFSKLFQSNSASASPHKSPSNSSFFKKPSSNANELIQVALLAKRLSAQKTAVSMRSLPEKKDGSAVSKLDIPIDYRNTALLSRFVSETGKILSRRYSGMSAKKQRSMSRAIRRSRVAGLLPFTSKLPQYSRLRKSSQEMELS